MVRSTASSDTTCWGVKQTVGGVCATAQKMQRPDRKRTRGGGGGGQSKEKEFCENNEGRKLREQIFEVRQKNKSRRFHFSSINHGWTNQSIVDIAVDNHHPKHAQCSAAHHAQHVEQYFIDAHTHI